MRWWRPMRTKPADHAGRKAVATSSGTADLSYEAALRGVGAQLGWWTQRAPLRCFQQMRCDAGMPRLVIRLSIEQPTSAPAF